MARRLDKPAKKCRLLLLDDEPLVRKGLELLLSQQAGLEVCGGAATAPEAMQQAATLDPDLVIADLTLKTGDGLQFIRELHQQFPRLKVLVFSMHSDAATVEAAVAAGAHGYVTKDEGTEQVLEAIQLLMRGEPYLSHTIAARMPGVPREVSPG